MTVAAVDYGTDADVSSEMHGAFGFASGFRNLANAIARRLQTPAGSLVYDPEYGTDVRAFLNLDVDAARLEEIRQLVVAEVEKDPRVNSCAAALAMGTSALNVTLSGVALNGPFALVLAITDVTVDVLDGTAPADRLAEPVVKPTVSGIPGPSGPPGSAGPAGASGSGITLAQSDLLVSTGAEVVLFQLLVDLSVLGSTMTAELDALGRVAVGTGTFRLRIGGTQDTADGTIVVTLSTVSSSFAPLSSAVSVSNPGGLQLVKVTGQSATIGQDAQIRGFTISMR